MPEKLEAFLSEHDIELYQLLIIAAAAVALALVLIIVLLVLLKTKKRKKKVVVYVEDALEGADFIEKNNMTETSSDIESDVF